MGGLNNRDLLSHHSRGSKSKIKVKASISFWGLYGTLYSGRLSELLVVCWTRRHPWLDDVSHQPLPASSHGILPSVSVWAHWSQWIRVHPNDLSYIYKDPVSKEGHILRFWGDMNFRGIPSNPLQDLLFLVTRKWKQAYKLLIIIP